MRPSIAIGVQHAGKAPEVLLRMDTLSIRDVAEAHGRFLATVSGAFVAHVSPHQILYVVKLLVDFPYSNRHPGSSF